MKEFISKNYQLISLIIGTILYIVLGKVIAYIVTISVGIFIFWGKATEKVELYNFDLLIYILYTIFSILFLLVFKTDVSINLVIVLGLMILVSYFINDKVKI